MARASDDGVVPIPADWSDPGNPRQMRYWDGAEWTTRRAAFGQNSAAREGRRGSLVLPEHGSPPDDRESDQADESHEDAQWLDRDGPVEGLIYQGSSEQEADAE